MFISIKPANRLAQMIDMHTDLTRGVMGVTETLYVLLKLNNLP